jgi:hypothetical protein
VKTEAKRTMRGTEVDGETYLSDYKEVHGMMVPFTMESGAKGGTMRQKMVVDSVEYNPNLPDSLFAMPAGTKPAATSVKSVAAAADSAATTAKPAKASKTAKVKKP